ncbi:hypothetical protein OR221_0725 [Microbacterium laevaniformans OR221]|jgi:hypothetical protein|nr:hypothetical protein OR221_0725 [Microbacterium laevaniformans OR221]
MIVLVGIVLAVLILVIVVWMLLARRLREKYAAMWLVIGFAVLFLGVFPQLLLGLAGVLGVQVPANLIFALGIVLLLGVSLHLSWELSQAEDEIRRLAEEAAIARAEIQGLAARLTLLERERADRGARDHGATAAGRDDGSHGATDRRGLDGSAT